MQWTQGYAPLGGNLLLSAACALVPIIFFFWALAVKRMKGYIAGLLTLAVSLAGGKSGDVRFSGSGVRAASDRLDYRHIGLFV